jgi:hypothetical protein
VHSQFFTAAAIEHVAFGGGQTDVNKNTITGLVAGHQAFSSELVFM